MEVLVLHLGGVLIAIASILVLIAIFVGILLTAILAGVLNLVRIDLKDGAA